MRGVAAFAIALFATRDVARAQTAPQATSTFSARILDARTERPIAEESILLPGLERTARSDASGNLTLTRLPAGKHIALVRAIGYDSLLFALDIAQGDSAEVDLLLSPIAQSLDKVKVEATSGLAAARMAEFDDRRKMGLGKFLDSTAFTEFRRKPFRDVLTSRIPGISIVRGQNGEQYLAARGGAASFSGKTRFANVILDGMSIGRYDVNQIDPDEILAVEYHTVATVPLKYRNTSIGSSGYAIGAVRASNESASATCGTLIIWRK